MLPYLLPPSLSDAELSCAFSGALPAPGDRRKRGPEARDEDAYFPAPRCIPPHDATTTTTSSIPSPPPEPSWLAEPTPCLDSPPDLAMVDFQQSLDLPETPALDSTSMPKILRNLRLPSFDVLGIAMPNAKIAHSRKEIGSISSGAVLPSPTDDLLHIPSSSVSYPIAPLQPAIDDAPPQSHSPDRLLPVFKAVRNYVLTHTPPDDLGSMDWSAPEMKTASSSSQNPSTSAQEGSTLPTGVDVAQGVESVPGMARQQSSSLRSGRVPWLRDALRVICRCNWPCIGHAHSLTRMQWTS
jgi:hypothetical protein